MVIKTDWEFSGIGTWAIEVEGANKILELTDDLLMLYKPKTDFNSLEIASKVKSPIHSGPDVMRFEFVFRLADVNNFYGLGLRTGGTAYKYKKYALYKMVNGQRIALGTTPLVLYNFDWFMIRVRMLDWHIVVEEKIGTGVWDAMLNYEELNHHFANGECGIWNHAGKSLFDNLELSVHQPV